MSEKSQSPEERVDDAGLWRAWLEALLREGLPRPAEDPVLGEGIYLPAARLAARELAPEGAGIGARLQAVSYLCVQGAAIQWQGRANDPRLCEDARLRTQRMASQLMALAGRQLALLERLEARRAKGQAAAGEAAARAAWQADAARSEALCRAMEAELKGFETAQHATMKSGGPAMKASLAGMGLPGVAAPPSQPLSRQQRRAQERQERKAARRLANAKPNGANGANGGP